MGRSAEKESITGGNKGVNLVNLGGFHAPGGNRTPGQGSRNPLLYPLSYGRTTKRFIISRALSVRVCLLTGQNAVSQEESKIAVNEPAPLPDTVSVATPPPTPTSVRFGLPRMGRKLREWLRTLHHDPSAEERAAGERRARLLDELNRAVADAPDDLPLRDVIARINNPYSD